MSAPARSGKPFDPSRGRWIPYAFVGGMLLVVAVNGGLVYAALSTFTGVTVPRAYERGRNYDHVLAEAARQEALGWRADVGWNAGSLRVSVNDRDGLPVPGRLEGRLQRPLEDRGLPLAFAAGAPGQWAARLGEIAPGQWEVQLTLHGTDDRRLDIRRRIVVP
jgi:nitrogen fixation protein FixH